MNRPLNGLSPKAIAFLFAVLSLNWESVIKTLVHHQHFSHEDAKNAIWKYACFLSLTCLYPNLTLIPSRFVDNVHHVFESSPDYIENMNQLSYAIEHRPYEEVKDDLTFSPEEHFKQTKCLLQHHFNFLISEGKQTSDEMSGCILRNAQHSGHPREDINATNIT